MATANATVTPRLVEQTLVQAIDYALRIGMSITIDGKILTQGMYVIVVQSYG
jgi:hypothetical protein